MCNWMFSGGVGGMGLPMMYGGIFMLATWALIIFVVIYLFRRFLPTHRPHALDVLQERYARGEIDADEYRERRKNLSE